MERIEDLIHKLVQQQHEGLPASQLLATVHTLYALLLKQQPQSPIANTGKVAVIMPGTGLVYNQTPTEKVPVEAIKSENDNGVEKEIPTEELMTPQVPAVEETRVAPPYKLHRPEEATAPPVSLQRIPANPELAFDALEDIPTLRQQPLVQKELHELLGSKQESLNDKLKLDKTELVQALKNEPIKDLRKGIGVNDKFLFISELFRGDEAMYERSIKTINAFHILPEAEYWINRELKVKLGWSDTKDTVQHFYGVVRRRFS